MADYKLSDLEVGMKVKFHDEIVDVKDWDNWAVSSMKKFLGETHIISRMSVRNNKFWIESDGGFYWKPSVIESVVEDTLYESELSFSDLFEVM